MPAPESLGARALRPVRPPGARAATVGHLCLALYPSRKDITSGGCPAPLRSCSFVSPGAVERQRVGFEKTSFRAAPRVPRRRRSSSSLRRVEADRRGSSGRPVSGQLGETVRLGLARTGRPAEARGDGSGEAFTLGVLRDQCYGAAGGEQRPSDAHRGAAAGPSPVAAFVCYSVGGCAHGARSSTDVTRGSHDGLPASWLRSQLRSALAATSAGRVPHSCYGKSHKMVREDFSKEGGGRGARDAPWLRLRPPERRGAGSHRRVPERGLSHLGTGWPT